MSSTSFINPLDFDNLVKYFKGDTLAAQVWLDKYALKDEEGHPIEKTPADMHWRMAKVLAEAEHASPLVNWRTKKKLSKYGAERFSIHYDADDFFGLFENFTYIVPGGSMMANLGNPGYGSTSNCFFVALEDDSMESIFKVGAQLASIFKYRGGCGINISKLRPSGAKVHNSAKTSSGSVSFTPLFSEISKVVGQEGRRAALMISISSNHPDVLDFITIKRNLNMVTGANISVQVTDEFMDAVSLNTDYYLRWHPKLGTDFDLDQILDLKTIDIPYNELISIDNFYIKKVKAKEIYMELVKSSHASAEPGILFWDNTLNYSLSAYYPEYREQGTNPCSEIPLADKDACRLFAINLGGFPITESSLYKIAYEQVVIADLSIDIEDKRIQQILDKIGNKSSIEYQLWSSIKRIAKNGRRIGCGITGLFEEIALKVAKNPELSKTDILKHVESLFKIKMKAELDATIDLAILKGTFKGYTNKESSQLIDTIKDVFPEQYKRMYKYGRRNVSFSTIAPTGTISILTGTTSGIEPLFAPYYIRRRKVSAASEKVDSIDVDGEKFTNHYIVHRGLIKYAQSQGIDVDNPNINWENIFNTSPFKGYIASDIPLGFRIELQGIAQDYTTHSISSTLNLPESVTTEQIDYIFRTAHLNSLKGITVYREGSRNGILVNQDTKDKPKFPQYDAPKRPSSLEGELHITKAQGDSYAIIVGILDNKPYEIFAALSQQYKPQKGRIIKVKRGVYKWIGADGAVIENLNTLSEFSNERSLTLLVSMLLRHGVKIPFVINVIKKTDSNIISFTSAICRVLSKYIQKEDTGEICPECGEKLIREAGCTKCTSCSYSICMIVYETRD